MAGTLIQISQAAAWPCSRLLESTVPKAWENKNYHGFEEALMPMTALSCASAAAPEGVCADICMLTWKRASWLSLAYSSNMLKGRYDSYLSCLTPWMYFGVQNISLSANGMASQA